jgi:hypothetical protein
MTNTTTDPYDDYTSTGYKMEHAARLCLAKAAADIEASIRGAFEPGDDPEDVAHQCIDGSEWVIYTARAEAVVRGFGEEEARGLYRDNFGIEEPPTIEALAYTVLRDQVGDLIEEIEEIEEANE